MTTLTKSIARKVLSIVDHPDGLTSGKGEPIPGQLCIEAAVCLALGLPHDDNPPCVGSAVRSFKITLNDCNWSSNQARAKGMRKLAVAQLGSDTTDQKKFAELLALKTVNRIVPGALRAAAKVQSKEHAAKLEDCAKACEAAKDLKAARAASYAASDAASYAASAAARAASDASDAARAARAASDAARAARDAASDAASDAARAAARAARAASDAASDASANPDAFLILMADIGLECLKELKSPGCKWLDLCE